MQNIVFVNDQSGGEGLAHWSGRIRKQVEQALGNSQ